MKPGVRKLQILRRAVQLSVVAFILIVPAVARYANYLSARELDQKMEKWQGTLPGATLGAIDSTLRGLPEGEVERAGRVQRNHTQVLSYAQQVRGGPWSAEIGPLSLTDPLAGVESMAAGKRVVWVLVLSLLVPVVATLALGRVFCSWICPMGLFLEMTDKLRAVMRFLEIHPHNLRASRAIKYTLLASGLLLAAVISTPVLGYIYPPAILSRELHDLVFSVFDRAEIGRFGVWFGALGWMTMLLLAIVVIELTVSRRWWCRYICPGGALYSLLGWARPVRIKLAASSCTGCARCVAVCPMALNPMKNQMGMECDNCGVCLSACDDDALAYGWQGPLASRSGEGFVAQGPRHREAA